MNPHDHPVCARSALSPIDSLRRRLKEIKAGRNRYRVILLDDLRAGYLPLAKVASTTLRMEFSKRQARLFYPNETAPTPQLLQKKIEKRIRKSMAPDQIKELSKTHFLFAFVRNPITRLYSCYLDKVVKASQKGKPCSLRLYGISADMSFDDFVRCVAGIPDRQADQHFRSQHPHVMANGEWLVQRLGKLEHFREEWDLLRAEISMEDLPLAVRRSTGAGNALGKVPLCRAVADMAVNRYGTDIDVLGYQGEITDWLASLP